MYVNDFNKKVQELDVIKGIKKRYYRLQELKGLSTDDVLNLQDKIKDKLEEIEQNLEDIVKIGDVLTLKEELAFDSDMSPDEIRQYGIKNRLKRSIRC